MNNSQPQPHGWHLVGHTEEVMEPGNYLTCEIEQEAVVVVRSDSGQLKALSRVCRHRGFDMLEGELTPDGDLIGRSGQVKRLRCPYHAWTYDLEGKLIAAPLADRICDFKKSDIALPEFALSVVDDQVFVNLDKNAAPLQADAAVSETATETTAD
mgnify:CR=1 FL=1